MHCAMHGLLEEGRSRHSGEREAKKLLPRVVGVSLIARPLDQVRDHVEGVFSW